MSKCAYCRQTGHNITKCNDPDIPGKVTRFESYTSSQDITQFLEWCSTSSLTILCARFKLGSLGTIKEKKDKLMGYWVSKHPSAPAPAPAPVQVPVQAPVQVPVQVPVQAPDQVIDLTTEDNAEDARPIVSAFVSTPRLTIQLPETLQSATPPPSRPPSASLYSPHSPESLPSPLTRLQPRSPSHPPPIVLDSSILASQSYDNIAPTTRLVPLSTVVRLRVETDAVLQTTKHAHDQMIKRLGESAYMDVRIALVALETGAVSGYAARLNTFNVRKYEILDEVRRKTGTSVIDYINVMIEYNRMLNEYPLFVSVPALASGPVIDSNNIHDPHNVMLDRHSIRRLPETHPIARHSDSATSVTRNAPAAAVPITSATTAGVTTTTAGVTTIARNVSIAINRPTPPPPVRSSTVQYSTANGKRHLLALKVNLTLDKSLSVKKPKRNQPPAAEVDECTICSEVYSNGRAPKSKLGCGHDMCGGCIVKIAQGRVKHTISCPFCRETIVKCQVGSTTILNTLDRALGRN